MKLKDPVPQIMKDIKSVKIQGATNVAIAVLTTLKKKIKLFPEVSKEEFLRDMESFKGARLTEPMTVNAMKYLGSCRSLSRTELRDRNDKGSGIAWQKIVSQEIDLFLSRLNDVGNEIVNRGLPLIKNNSVILTHCHSSSVEKMIIAAVKQGKNLTIFVTETRPLNQGRLTADHLTRAGVNVIMITDSAAPNIITNGYREDKKDLKINLILAGVDAIEKTGNIAFNKVGTFGIAQSAHLKKIPFYIVGSLLKTSALKVLIEIRKDTEIYSIKRKQFDAYNPAFDKVPANLIAGFVTEFGVISPKKVNYLTKKYYPFIFKRKTKIKKGDWINPPAREIDRGSTNPYKNYLHLQEKINLNELLVVTYRLKVEEDVDFLNTAGGVAAESSVGTWTRVKTEFKNIWEKLHARVFEADEKTGIVKIAYPLELFEPGNIAQLLSSVAGNIFGLKEVKNLRLMDLEMPAVYVASFDGPAIGMEGIRKITGVYNSPLIGSIIKPKLGLNFRDHVKIAMEVFRGGGNLVKDDENLTSQTFNPFFDRVQLMTTAMKKFHYLHNPEGEKIYAFNVTAEAETMKERASFIKVNGGNCAMVDVLTAGFSGLQFLRRQNFGLIIHGHRAMHAAFTRDVKEGVSMLVLAKLARLAGVDELHTGTVVGKMEGGEKEVVEINNFLRSEWFGIKPVMPVASGGLHPALIPDLIKYLGKDIVFNFGGGIHGHPKGTYHGVKAVKEGMEAVLASKDWNGYVSTHEDLKEAIAQWK
jgi:ribulose-bisphosphate carboxylase large chain